MVDYSDESRIKKQRRQHIVDVAKKVCFEESIANATMNDIAKKAGIGRSTIYEYFNSKYELLSLIRRIYLDEIYDFNIDLDLGSSGFEQLESILIAYADNLLNKPKQLIFFMEYNRFVSVSGVEEKNAELGNYKTHEYFEKILEKGVKDGTLNVSNIEKRISIVVEALFGAATRFAIKEQYAYNEIEVSVHRNDMLDLIPMIIDGFRTSKCKML